MQARIQWRENYTKKKMLKIDTWIAPITQIMLTHVHKIKRKGKQEQLVPISWSLYMYIDI